MAARLLSNGPPEPVRPSDPDAGPPVDARLASAALHAPSVDVGAPMATGWTPQRDRLTRRPVASVVVLAAVATSAAAYAAGLHWPSPLATAILVSAFLLAWATVLPELEAANWDGAASSAVRPAVLERRLTWLRRRRPDIFIIGDSDFCHSVAAAAGGRRRVTGQWLFDGDAGGPELLPASSSELVVHAGVFRDLRDRLPEVFEGRNRVIVVPEGKVHDRLFSGPLGPVASAFKRALDISVSLAALILCAPCLALAILAVRIDSRGPAVFRQVRVGAGGRRFTLYKLRTMTVGDEDPAVLAYMANMVRCEAEPENGMFKLGSNRRITRVGRILRRFSVDEVPQLLNVLKGDMSLVGPRPCILEEAACYNEFHWQRLAVRPGITGLAQVNGRSRLRFDDIVTLDVRYSRCWSPLLELKILMRTPAAVLSGRGAT
jgi:lipopolysaccharide/colanic/teichoic acid biosynthesis glycosyltransferase